MRKKTSVYLGEREAEHLAHLSRVEGRPQADIIRSAILAYRAQPEKREFALAGAFAGPGGSIADIPEEELLKGFGE